MIQVDDGSISLSKDNTRYRMSIINLLHPVSVGFECYDANTAPYWHYKIDCRVFNKSRLSESNDSVFLSFRSMT